MSPVFFYSLLSDSFQRLVSALSVLILFFFFFFAISSLERIEVFLPIMGLIINPVSIDPSLRSLLASLLTPLGTPIPFSN